MVQRRRILAVLTRSRLVDLARDFEVPGLSGKPKDQIVAGMAAARSVKTAELLEAMTREEVKAACRALGLDDAARAKAELIGRLLGEKEQGDRGMAKKNAGKGKRRIEPYQHKDKTRVNNPPVGLVTPQTDPDQPKRAYQYDPHIDPSLQWAGKAEHTSFEVPTASLHVHERIDPRSIIRAVQKRNGNGGGPGKLIQRSLFEEPEENPPLREAIEFYKHAHGWTNRLIAGDSLMVMNSLLEKEGLAGKVQMVYIDPPYGIKYGSNFQPFVNKRDVKDGNDEDLTQEPEMIRAFRDTWELGIHSYLSYLRDRLRLARDLLNESGSCFVQIGDENVHHVREVMDEVFGTSNRVSIISVRKSGMMMGALLKDAVYYIIWCARDKDRLKYRQLYLPKEAGIGVGAHYNMIEAASGTQCRRMTDREQSDFTLIPHGWKPFTLVALKTGGYRPNTTVPYTFQGKTFHPGDNNCWRTTVEGLDRLAQLHRLQISGNTLRYKQYLDDFPAIEMSNLWTDTGTSGAAGKVYAVQTIPKLIQRSLLMTTDPGDLVCDPTCGSGTTAAVAEQWGRRWITCDTSRVAITLAKQRLMTAVFDYYQLARPEEGVGSGFVYKTVPHVTLKSIANNPELREGMTRAQIDAAIAKYAEQETLYDQPLVDRSKVRVTGPFTVEAVPAPAVRPITEILLESQPVSFDEQPTLPGIGPLELQSKLQFTEDVSVARFGETLRQRQWRDELLACGIRGKGGQRIQFARLEPLGATRWLQCEGETKALTPTLSQREREPAPSPQPSPKGRGSQRPDPDPLPKGEGAMGPQRVVVSFGPEHAPLEQRQVELALEEAVQLKPTPKVVIFAAFQFDPEAAKDIDETNWPGVTLLKAQMNTDLLTDDLKKKRSSNESYWLIGQPDVELRQIAKGEHKGKCQVEVHGFDYYNPRTGAIESGDTTKIAMWMLDTDYDGRSLFPRQVFFPMAGPKDGWARLAKNLKAEIDEDLIEAYRGTVSLPFEPGEYRRAAVKIVDDRGIESLKIVGIG